jgi:hypothetical protein
MWWSKTAQRAFQRNARTTAVLRNPSRPKGGEHLPFVKRRGFFQVYCINAFWHPCPFFCFFYFVLIFYLAIPFLN